MPSLPQGFGSPLVSSPWPISRGPFIARQHMLACVRGVFANATATSIRGLRSIMAISQLLCGVPNRSTACRIAIHCPAVHVYMHERGARNQQPANVALTHPLPVRVMRGMVPRGFEVFPRRDLPPVEFCLGTNPSQAAKSRPQLCAVAQASIATTHADRWLINARS
jgi:hypothetical protein